jgi:hypothetical protein
MTRETSQPETILKLFSYFYLVDAGHSILAAIRKMLNRTGGTAGTNGGLRLRLQVVTTHPPPNEQAAKAEHAHRTWFGNRPDG